jgi:hypothetical protein
MQRWEYWVVALRGEYTTSLNELGSEGWELVSVVSEPRSPEEPKRGASFPVPRALGRLEEAADKLTNDAPDEGATSRLLWVFRRPLD